MGRKMASAERYLLYENWDALCSNVGAALGVVGFRGVVPGGGWSVHDGAKKNFFDCGERSLSERAIEGNCRDAPDRDTNIGPSE